MQVTPFKPQSRARRLFHLLAGFFLGQAAVQGISVIIGIFLVRTLDVRSYAEFGLAFGFQATASVLMDLGFAGTIIPLVGEHASNPELVGKYVRRPSPFGTVRSGYFLHLWLSPSS